MDVMKQMGPGGSTAAYGEGRATERPKESEARAIVGRLDRIRAAVAQLAASSGDVADRLCGSRPEKELAGSAHGEVSNSGLLSELNTITAEIERLTQVAFLHVQRSQNAL